ncbi:type I-E CRISPR-associated protein Cas6/Cse3/CasE [Thermosynechococcaceae cyanobacterium Okahandja]
MYLSQLVLNERQPQVYRDLVNAHKFHQRVMQAFPDEEERQRPRADWHILYRHEPDSDVVLVQSAVEPEWSRLPEGYLQRYDTKRVHLTPDLVGGDRVFQFRLRANPSKRDPNTRKTIGFYHRADQLAWLERQAKRCGFELLGVDVIPSPNVFALKTNSRGPVRVVTALYQGTLKVTDPAAFLRAVQQGIGRGKSYGCGLLSIARVRSGNR